MSSPKISIITASYNAASSIEDTLNSIANQSYSNIEHIIIDGYSKDNTLKIVKEFPHISKVISEKDQGIYDAMNKGIKLATGEIIGILNSDDLYQNDFVLEKVANAFSDNTDAVYGDLHYVDENDIDKVVRDWKSGPYKKKNFLYGWIPPHPTFFVRSNVYKKYGYFNPSLNFAADYEFMLRCLFKHNISVSYIPEVLVKMRIGGVSNSSLKNRFLANKEDRIAWAKNNLSPYFFTTYLKPIRKIVQYF